MFNNNLLANIINIKYNCQLYKMDRYKIFDFVEK